MVTEKHIRGSKMNTKYIRKGRTIKDLNAGTIKTFEFINEAKRHSRELQMQNGGLGRGSLMVD